MARHWINCTYVAGADAVAIEASLTDEEEFHEFHEVNFNDGTFDLVTDGPIIDDPEVIPEPEPAEQSGKYPVQSHSYLGYLSVRSFVPNQLHIW